MTSFQVGVAEGGPSRDIDSFQDHLSETPVNPWCCIVYHCVHTTHTHLCMAYNESTESTESTETPAVIYMFDFFSQNMITWYGSTSGPENYFLFGNSVYIERVVHLQDTDTNTYTHTYIHTLWYILSTTTNTSTIHWNNYKYCLSYQGFAGTIHALVTIPTLRYQYTLQSVWVGYGDDLHQHFSQSRVRLIGLSK